MNACASFKEKVLIPFLIFFMSGTIQAREYHVSKDGDDKNNGEISSPLKTISAAALKAMPGDIITVHAGVYREYINPRQGGTSEEKRITYRAGAGEIVVLKESEQISGWVNEGEGLWKVVIPNSFFGSYNPYERRIGWVDDSWLEGGFWTHCGDVYLNGEAYYEKKSLYHVRKSANTWHTSVNDTSTYIWVNFGKANPNKELAEINVRESIFFPKDSLISYITLSGFSIMHSDNGWAPPATYQGGAIGPNGGQAGVSISPRQELIMNGHAMLRKYSVKTRNYEHKKKFNQ